MLLLVSEFAAAATLQPLHRALSSKPVRVSLFQARLAEPDCGCVWRMQQHCTVPCWSYGMTICRISVSASDRALRILA